MLHNQNGAGLNNFNLYYIINNTPDAIWCFDVNFTLIAANKAFYQLRSTNHRQEIDIGDSIFLHSSPEAIEKWRLLYNKTLSGEVVFIEDIKTIDGQEYYYEINITPVYDEADKTLIACVAIAKDVTGRKKAEKAISAYGKRFKSFTFKTTHEIRNPLANILALVEFGRNEDITLQEMKDLFSMLETSARQLDGVVKELIFLMSKQNR